MRGLLLLITTLLIGCTARDQDKQFELSGTKNVALDTIHYFFLGGQSNMNGFGYTTDLPDTLRITMDDVRIFQGNPVGDSEPGGGLGRWAPLQPGHGINFKSNGNINILSNRFGPELTFGYHLRRQYPGKKLAIIKYARSGSAIDCRTPNKFGCWSPDFETTNQFDHFTTTLENALSSDDIDGDGKRDFLIPAGIIWMQGESDGAYTEPFARQYSKNLARLMQAIRRKVGAPAIPVVIGQITDSGQDIADGKVWDYGAIIQAQQALFVEQDVNALLVVSTQNYGYSDPWHYDSKGYIDLGCSFAEAIAKLNKKSSITLF